MEFTITIPLDWQTLAITTYVLVGLALAVWYTRWLVPRGHCKTEDYLMAGIVALVAVGVGPIFLVAFGPVYLLGRLVLSR